MQNTMNVMQNAPIPELDLTRENLKQLPENLAILQHLSYCLRAVSLENLIKICSHTIICHRIVTKNSIIWVLFSNGDNDIFSYIHVKACN